MSHREHGYRSGIHVLYNADYHETEAKRTHRMPSHVNDLPRLVIEFSSKAWLAGVRYEIPLPSSTSSKAPTSTLCASSSQEALVRADVMLKLLGAVVVEGGQQGRSRRLSSSKEGILKVSHS